MTFTISVENFYFFIVIVLMIIQIYQWRIIEKLKSEVDSIWKQIHVLTINIASEIINLKKQKDVEQENQEKV
jgi:hypothetical protein